MKMNRRDAIKSMSLSAAALAAAPWSLRAAEPGLRMEATLRYPYVLPGFPYAPEALDHFIDVQTMGLHHDKHHATYVNQLNKALESAPEWQPVSLLELLQRMEETPESIRTAVRNHGGGHANHCLFWLILQPEESAGPAGALAEQVNTDFGSTEELIAQLRRAALSVFGSGWAWLSSTPDGLKVETTPNQDSPWMHGHRPLLGIDVWEHAYYLKYQNRRADYVDGVLKHINWDTVAAMSTAG